jgi:hypothetical protein
MKRNGIHVDEVEIFTGSALHAFFLRVSRFLLIDSPRNVRNQTTRMGKNKFEIGVTFQEPAKNNPRHSQGRIIKKSKTGDEIVILYALVADRMRRMQKKPESPVP